MIANDPDADRLAVAVPDPHADGGWRRLSGNQIGLLLGWRAARRARDASAGARAHRSPARSVSSPGLQTVAEHYGLDFHATLTGFKWISRAPGPRLRVRGGARLSRRTPRPCATRTASRPPIAMLGMVAEARGRGASLAGLSPSSATTFGYFASDQISIRVDDVSMHRPDHGRAAGAASVVDRRVAGRAASTTCSTASTSCPPGDVLRLWLADGSRVIVRPSGTEPKLKLYLDVRGETPPTTRRRGSPRSSAARARCWTRFALEPLTR